ncbi:MFS transporter [Streptomyces sp. MUM 178J]|uniref:MFS transporter n=1 Tax=Streptomyces sp. MUM 178J TaxID=2791991 RepID=UPI0027E31C9F|nr:MFS transporter [Streptomyces sp. MUM 178J]WRQ81149.1 MFS transporter [Streptomyces sp. MUM 178J]
MTGRQKAAGRSRSGDPAGSPIRTGAARAGTSGTGRPATAAEDAPATASAEDGATPPGERHGTRPRGPDALRRPAVALALLAATQLLMIMDTALVNVALPSIGRDLGSGSAGLSWVANGYLITFGGLLLLGGRTADLFGRRRVYLAGLGLLAAASAAGAVAGSSAQLIAARTAQGVGAALAAAAAFAVLLGLFPDGPARHRALGVFAAMGGLGGVLGTVLGGVLTDLLGWRSTFWLNVLVAAALGLLALRVLDAGTPDARPGFDLAGALGATSGLGLVAYALVGAGEAGWTGVRTLAAGTAGLGLLAAFALWERRTAHPLVPPGVLRRPALRRANVLSALAQMALFPMFFLVSLYLQSVLEHSPLTGGLGLLPLSLVVVALAPQTGRLIGRLGLRTTMAAGFALLLGGMVWLALSLSADGTFATAVLAPSLVLGAALPLVMVTTNVAATAEAAPEETGLASGLINTSQQFGSVLGLAVLVAVATGGLGPEAADAARTAGFRAALLVGAGFAALAVLLSLRLRLPAPPPAPASTSAPESPHTAPASTSAPESPHTAPAPDTDRVGGAVE